MASQSSISPAQGHLTIELPNVIRIKTLPSSGQPEYDLKFEMTSLIPDGWPTSPVSNTWGEMVSSPVSESSSPAVTSESVVSQSDSSKVIQPASKHVVRLSASNTKSHQPTPVTAEPSGIRWKFSKGEGGLKFTYTLKRPADHLDVDIEAANTLVSMSALDARLSKYTPAEIEAAKALLDLKEGPPVVKRVKVTPTAPRRKSARQASSGSSKAKSQPPAPSQDDSDDIIILKSTSATRKQRTVDPNDPADAHLILLAVKASSDIYDSDAEDLPGDCSKQLTSKPELFRNVRWGPAATDMSNEADFPTEPEFSQFVPGRWERLAEGSVRDQKHKLLIKMTSKDGRKLIFKNPPPKDWTDQKALTCLNKRISQQIRRNTDVRFREEVEPYLREERVWINEHLVSGKPGNGWKAFVAEFNVAFAGKVLEGAAAPRPLRTHSSLTKEIERFGKDFYSKGLVPVTKGAKGAKGKGKAKAKDE